MRRLMVSLLAALCLAGCGATPTAVPTLVSITATSAPTTAAAATATAVPPTASPTPSGQGGSVKKPINTAVPVEASATPATTAAQPTATPVPTPLPQPTAGPLPTSTPLPPTQALVPTATPVPSGYAVSPYFDGVAPMVWDVPVPYGYTADVGANTLGQPMDAGTWTQLSRQWFGPYYDAVCTSDDSLMVWQADTRQISFLTVGSDGSSTDCYPEPWYRYQDTYQVGDSNNEGEQAPAGQVVPVLGFGKVWREIRAQENVELGFATTEEKATEGMVQRFQNGAAYYFQDTASICVLFDSYRRIARSTEEYTSLTWFDIVP